MVHQAQRVRVRRHVGRHRLWRIDRPSGIELGPATIWRWTLSAWLGDCFSEFAFTPVIAQRGDLLPQLILIGPTLYFFKPRIPLSRTRRLPVVGFAVGFSFVKTRTFWALQLGNVVQGLGYFIPALYIPSISSFHLQFHTLTNSTGRLCAHLASLTPTILPPCLPTQYRLHSRRRPSLGPLRPHQCDT